MAIIRERRPDRRRPTGGEPADELLYQSERTRVTRVHLPADAGVAICKEALGGTAEARIRHETGMLTRLAGVAGVPRLAAASRPHSLLLDDAGGRSLASVLTSDRIALAELPGFALRLATIVAEVHRAGIVHRDINPTNVLVAPDGWQPTLIDFDLATSFAESRPAFTHHREIVGRLAYLAPEQTGRAGLPMDQRADLYALGATLYELASGAPPFSDGDEDPLHLIHLILTAVPRPLCELVPEVSPGLSAIVARLLEKEPDRRYQSAQGLVHDLALLCAAPAEPLRLGDRDFPSRLSAPSRLVGRESELRQLGAALDRALDTRYRGVLITGEPGVGKSALIDQLRPMVTTRGGWFVSGRFDQYRPDSAASPAIQALGGIGRLLLAEPEAALLTLRSRILAEVGANAGLLAAVLPEFASLLGMASGPEPEGPTPPPAPVDPVEAASRLRQAALDTLRVVAGPGRPIVLVLDDLQRADPAGLSFVDAVQTDEQLRGLLLVTAYREQELDPAHPLSALLARWQRLGLAPTTVRLGNLTAQALAELLAEMLRLSAERAADLAHAVGERTGGNPYDTVELINGLRRDGALVLGNSGWSWHPATIREYVGQGDVLDLLRARLDRLPTGSLGLLEILSCLGGEVRLDLLATAAGRPIATVEEQLVPALEDGLLVLDEKSEPSAADTAVDLVCFRHDRVAQAVGAGIGPRVRTEHHLTIARRLAGVDRAVQAAEQYLAAVAEVTDAAERRLVAELFRTAAAAARRSSNDRVAERYLSAARQLWIALGVDGEDPALAGLETERHAALYSLGRLEEADEAYTSIWMRCRDPLDLVDAACVQISSLTNRRRPEEAVEIGLSLLSRLGFDLPGAEQDGRLRQRFTEVVEWIGQVSLVEELRRPQLSEARELAAARLIARMVLPAAITDQPLTAWLVTEGHRLWAAHGPSGELMVSIGYANVSLIGDRDDYLTGYRLLRHVLAVGEGRGFEPGTSYARFLYAASASHWVEPLEESLRHAQAAREGLLRGGDPQAAAFAYLTSITGLLDSAPTVDSFGAETAAALAFAARTGNDQAAAGFVLYQQLLRALRGETAKLGTFHDGTFDEESYLAANAQANPLGVAYLHILRALASALFGDALGVGHRIAALRPLAGQLTGTYPTALIHLLHALYLAQQLRAARPAAKQALLDELDACRHWLALRAVGAPSNFLHLVRLVEAERCWAVDDFQGAALAFDAGLLAADLRHRPWHHALLAERAGLFYLQHGLERAGRTLLAEARRRYQAWGASAKVHELERLHPFLRGDDPAAVPAIDVRHSGSVSSDVIDMLAILRASQALGSETNLTRLRASIKEQLRAITGATKVLILLRAEQSGELFLPADAAGNEQPLAITDPGLRRLLPVSVLRYVERTREPLLVADATRDDRFAKDPYIGRLERCSLLVVPILNQGSMRAMLLLENRLSSGAFSADRLDAVMLITGQLAVSLDNAVLYASLEEKVADRTKALQAANEQLETLSVTDALTELANRRRFDDVLEAEWQRALVTHHPLGIIMVDIDNFKRYNDYYGHLAGDECIRMVARALVGSSRQSTDLVCRYGGEEFAIIVPGADTTGAMVVAERARAAVAALAQPHAQTDAGIVTVSMGVAAVVPAAGGSPDGLVGTADGALYEAKRNGRNRVRAA